MDRRLVREANKAHRHEVQAERKEARLHCKAVNQALRGNLGRAVNLEHRANNQAVRANRAHDREQAATAAYVAGVARTTCPRPAHCPPHVMPTPPAPGVTTYTVTQTTYAPGPPQSAYYPVGQQYPPTTAPPPYAPQAYPTGYYPPAPYPN